MEGDIPKGVKTISIFYFIGAVLLLLTTFGLFQEFAVIIPMAVLSILGLGIFAGIILLLPDYVRFSLFSNEPGIRTLEQIESMSGVYAMMDLIIGAVFFVLAALCFFIGWGLRKRKQWARITAIIIAFGGIALGVYSIFISGDIIYSLVMNIVAVIIGGYLIFNKRVKEVFTR